MEYPGHPSGVTRTLQQNTHTSSLTQAHTYTHTRTVRCEVGWLRPTWFGVPAASCCPATMAPLHVGQLQLGAHHPYPPSLSPSAPSLTHPIPHFFQPFPYLASFSFPSSHFSSYINYSTTVLRIEIANKLIPSHSVFIYFFNKVCLISF